MADAKQTNLQKARELSIQRCIPRLVHSCHRRKDADCRLPSCQRIKRVVMHTKNCKKKTTGGCPIRKQLLALCCYHAKHCQETKYIIPFCSNSKHKIKQQQLQQRLQQAQLLRRRMVDSYRRKRLVGQVGPQAQSNMQTQNALQQLMQTLRSPYTPEQQNQILQILESNPLMAAFIEQLANVHQRQPDQHDGGLGPNQPQQQQQPSLQHIMSVLQQQQQGRLQIQAMLTQQAQQQQPMQPQTQWYKQQMMVMQQRQQRQQQAQQQQQQQQQLFTQPPAPPYGQQRPIRPSLLGNRTIYRCTIENEARKANGPMMNNSMGYFANLSLGYGGFNEQGYGQPGLNLHRHHIMGPPGISVQQLMQSVRSPPPNRSP